jgi:hypothetical protein
MNDFQGVSNDFYNYDEDNESETMEEDSVESNHDEFESFEESNEESQEEIEKSSDYDDLYKVRIVDGQKTMKVICPYCGNIETINLD